MKRMSFNRLLHNNKLILIFSAIAAVAIWYTVISGPGNITEKEISLTLEVDNANTYSYQQGYRIYGTKTFEITVRVQGPFSVLSKLSSDDIRARADTSEISGSGRIDLPVQVYRNTGETDYEFIAVTPSQVSVTCDIWEDIWVPVEPDVSNVSTDAGSIGTPSLDTTSLTDGKLRISGPQRITKEIKAVRAVVPEGVNRLINDTQTFTANIVAVGANDAPVDLTGCETGISSGTIKMTVPVLLLQEITFRYQTSHMPPSQSAAENFITLSPSRIVLQGERAALERYSEDIADLGILDFDNIDLPDKTIILPLDIPSSLHVVDDYTEVSCTLDMKNYTSKTIDLNFDNPDHAAIVTYTGLAPGKSASLLTKNITVKLIGPAKSVSGITYRDLSITIDTSGFNWQSNALVRVAVRGKEDVWVYYGKDNAGGFEVFVEIIT